MAAPLPSLPESYALGLYTDKQCKYLPVGAGSGSSGLEICSCLGGLEALALVIRSGLGLNRSGRGVNRSGLVKAVLRPVPMN